MKVQEKYWKSAVREQYRPRYGPCTSTTRFKYYIINFYIHGINTSIIFLIQVKSFMTLTQLEELYRYFNTNLIFNAQIDNLGS